ncbi:MAG: BTAD domain-containing putative transcriptional regulator [Actinomycetota bacterium]
MTIDRLRTLSRALAGLVALLGLLVGVPVALAALAGWPLPRSLPDPAALGRLLGSRAELPPEVVFKALALVGWVAWAEVAAATIVELVAFARRTDAPRLPLPLGGPAQALAARLVTAAAVFLVPLRVPAPPAAVPLASIPVVHVATVAAPTATAPSPSPETPTAEPAAPATDHVYTVKPDDWLSRIARTHLGATERWPEIFQLNQGRPQHDGRALTDPDLIRPGWQLRLPLDPHDVEEAAAPPPSSPTAAPSPPPDSAPEPADADTVSPAERTPSSEPTPAPPESTPAATALAEATDASASAAPIPTPPPFDLPSPMAPPVPSDPAAPSANGEARAPSPPTSAAAPAAPRGDGNAPTATDRDTPAPDRGILATAFVALVAGVGVLRLGKLRANQQRLRRRGRDVPRPPAPLQEAEARVRAIADEDAPMWVDAVSRSLWSTLENAPAVSIPRIIAVRVGAAGVELLLDAPHPDAPDGYQSADAARVWRLDPTVDLERLKELAQGQSAALPALLAVGETPEGPLLLDLEHAGTLAVEGDPERVAAFLAGAALELAAAPWAADVPVVLVGADPALAVLDQVELADAEQISRRFPAPPTTTPDTHARHPLAERVRPDAAEHLAPTAIVVAPGAATAETLGPLAATAQAGSGVVLIAPGPLPGVSCRLHIEADGSARLEPVGIDVTSGISANQVAELAALLAQAAEQDDVALVVDLPTSVPDKEPEPEPELWVRVLGPVEVDWPGKPPRPRSAELVVYLATHDERPVPGDRLRVALWPGDDEVADATLLSTVSRARTALGEDQQGLPHLPDAESSCYHLRPGVSCDWRRFRDLTSRARHASDPAAIDLLRDALALVRGAPFADPPKGAYGWALAELASVIEVAVVEAAERLGELALTAGQAELAAWAARQGLLACPGREGLYQLLMRASDLAGDPDGVDAAWRELRRAVRAIDPLEEPRADTIALYESLTERRRHRVTPDELRASSGGAGDR